MDLELAITLSEHTFPHEVRHRDVTGHVMLYAEQGRRRATYRFYGPDGNRSQKEPVPKALGAAAFYPDPVTTVDDYGTEREVVYVPKLMIKWALRYLEARADDRRGIARELAAAKARQNHVKIGYVFQRLRDSAWYRKLAKEKPRRLHEVDLPMRWVESVLGYDFLLSGWNAETLVRLETARKEEGIHTHTLDGQPTFLRPRSHNTFVGDIKILKQVFEEATEIPFREGAEAWLLDVNPMARVRRKMPKFGARRPREAIDDFRYQLLSSVADEVDPTGRFQFFLVLLRWTGRRVSTILRLTRDVLCFTAPEIKAALERQLCRYVLPHEIERTARLYAANGGAMYVRYWMVKGGQRDEAGKVEQYDAVHPVHPLVIDAAAEYLDGHWNKLNLGPGGPLFPSGKVITRAMSNEQVYSWFRIAARLVAERGESLGMTPNNAYHGLRYNRRTELVRVDTKYGRWLCEHSVLSGTPGITVSEGVYQGLIPRELVKAVGVGTPAWDEE